MIFPASLLLCLCGVQTVKLSVPLLVLQPGTDSCGTIYLLDAKGRSDSIAQALKSSADFTSAKVSRYVTLAANDTLVKVLGNGPDLPECTEHVCPAAGQGCFVNRASSVIDAGGPEKLKADFDTWKGATGSGATGPCSIVFSANTINISGVPSFANAWAPLEATMLSLTCVIVVLLFAIALLPSLCIKDGDIMPEVESKAD